MSDSKKNKQEFLSRCCCFFGHRKINVTDELRNRLYVIVEELIVQKQVSVFLFGSKSQFDSLCCEVVSALKEEYPHIRRIYVRAEFPYITDDYKTYLLKSYEDTYYPDKVERAGKAAYVERNYEMINKSDCCVVYHDENYQPPRRKNSRLDLSDYQPKSGTKLAYDYAIKQKKNIVNLFKIAK